MITAHCGNCRNFRATSLQPSQGSCHANPPTAIAIPVRDMIQGQGIALQGVWAPVPESEWCAAHHWLPETDEN